MTFFLTVLKLLKKPRTLLIVLLGLVLLLLFGLGAKLGINVFWRLIIGGALLLVGLFFAWLIGRIEKRRQADEIEQSLVCEAASGPDDRSRKRQAREEMAAAISHLKASRLGDGRSGREALSVLPWFLVVGAPGVGKSAMISRSGLPFPAGGSDPASACTVGDNCCWWFSNQAVILEADGRFAIDSSSTADADWDIFLGLLRKQQRKPVLNAVMVAIGADDLVSRDEAWLIERAALLRRRLDRIAGGLDLLCPVYLVITRCALINGFQEYFGDLQGSARDQVWGATFSANLLTSPVPGDLLRQEFDLLAKALDRRRLSRLIRTEQDRPTQQQAFLFPLEFYKLRDKLCVFSEALFAPSSYAHQPPWRGFYFSTTGGSEGQPAETVLSDFSQVIGLPGFAGYAPPPPVQGSRREARFLKTLFLNVLIPDQGLARPTARALRRQHSWRLVLRGLALLALPVFLTLNGISLVRNLHLAGEGRRLVEEVRGVKPETGRAADILDALSRLEPLRRQIEQLDAWESWRPLTLSMGLYRGDRIGDDLRRAYFDRLREVLLKPGRDGLESELSNSHPRNREDFNRFFARYQAYRMLMRPDQGKPALVADELRALWQEAATTERHDDLIEQHVALAWRHPGDLSEACSDLPRAADQLVKRAEGYVREFWASDLYYESLIADVNNAGQPFSPGLGSFFVGAAGSAPDALAVPYAFTRDGWRGHVLPGIRDSELELKENWLLQEVFREQALDIRSELLARYLGEHRERWVALLNSVDIPPAFSLGEAQRRMRDLAAGNSPLLRLLEQVGGAMDLGTEVPGLPDGDVAAFQRAATDFHSWREFFKPQGQGDQEYHPATRYTDQLNNLDVFLDQLLEELDPDAAAAEASRKVYRENGGGQTALETASRQIRNLIVEGGAIKCDRALEAFLRRPIQMAWSACLRATEEHLDAQWSEDVVNRFNDKLRGYPLDPGASQEVSLNDFGEFFRANGTLDSFVSEQLSDFLTRDWHSRPVLDGSLRLSEEATIAMERAEALRRVLFAGEATEPRVEFTMLPRQITITSGDGSSITGTRFHFGEQDLVYQWGQHPGKQFTWPATQLRPSAGVSLRPAGRFGELSVDRSDWALFRLIEKGEVKPRDNVSYDVTWVIDDGRSTPRVRVPYVLTAGSAANPFGSKQFFAFDCPQRLFRN